MIFQRRQKALWSKGLKGCHIMMKINELRYLPEGGHISKELSHIICVAKK